MAGEVLEGAVEGVGVIAPPLAGADGDPVARRRPDLGALRTVVGDSEQGEGAGQAGVNAEIAPQGFASKKARANPAGVMARRAARSALGAM